MASLFVIRGKNAGQHFPLRGSRVILGRDASCDIQVVDHEVSRQHAEVIRNEQGYFLVDLSSSNGCFLNGQRVSRQLIHSGDRLQIGRTLLVFNGQSKSPSSANPSKQGTSPFTMGVDIVNSKEASHSSIDLTASRNSNDQLSQIRHVLMAPALDSEHDIYQKPQSQSSQWETPSPDSSKALNVGSSNDSSSQTGTNLDNNESSGNLGRSVSVVREKSHWEMMYQTVIAVSRTLDLDQLLGQILDLIFQWVHCDRGCIMLIHEESGKPRPSARKFRNEDSAATRIEVSQTILDYVIRTREGVLTSNASDDTRWESAASIAAAGIREAICVPMQGRYGIVGAIYIDTSRTLVEHASDPNTPMFDEEHLKMMVAIGHQAALAVEDTFYYRGMVQAEKLAVMGQTIANLSHHVKNILQGLSGGSYLVAEGIKRQQLDTIAKGWRIVEKNQERIGSMVMDMLTYSKDRQPLLAATDLRVTIDDCFELCVSRAHDLEVALKWNRPESFPSILADSEALHRAILNVMHNAIDAVADLPNGQVYISLSFDSDFVVIEIRDNGVGIPADDMQRIFSVFESSKGSRGTGLGLPVSQKILREHGGEIEVTSQIGQGSSFRLILPNRTPSAETQPLNQEPTLY